MGDKEGLMWMVIKDGTMGSQVSLGNIFWLILTLCSGLSTQSYSALFVWSVAKHMGHSGLAGGKATKPLCFHSLNSESQRRKGKVEGGKKEIKVKQSQKKLN